MLYKNNTVNHFPNEILRLLLFVFSFLGFSTTVSFAQKFVYQAGVHSFFNNNEFTGCSVKNSQTMAGVHFTPQLGLSFEGKHLLFAGVDALHEFGSDRTIDDVHPVAYYQLNSQPFVFYMGAFPRKHVLDHYPRMFFQDSVQYYRPVINGIFWEYRSKNDDYLNAWLDWTSRQTEKRRETFFMGFSGRLNLGLFYAQHFLYMFHFAGRINPPIPEKVHDNGLALTSIGVDLAEKADFEKLELNAGWSVGLEHDRGSDDGWQKPHGFFSELKIEYRGIGLLNTFYSGQEQQVYFYKHQNQLYWGDQAYRASKYDRADFYIQFIKNQAVQVKLIYSLHFIENKMFHEQSLLAAIDLDNLSKNRQKEYRYFWSNWFK